MSIILRTIKGNGSFSQIFQAGKRFRCDNSGAVVIFFDEKADNFNPDKLNNSNDLHIIYYGVSIGKKVAKKAVVRNRVKRLMRESLRISIKEIEPKKLLSIKKIIFTYYSAPLHPMQIKLQDVLPAIKNILEQANLHYLEKYNS
jgi:ribonuclease P protein component